MGAKTWMLVYTQADVVEALKRRPQLNQEETLGLAKTLFPNDRLAPIGYGDLSYTSPPDDELYIGCFPGVSVVAAIEFAIDYPSTLPQPFIDAGRGATICLHAMHSAVDWFAYARWSNGELVRSLSLSPDSGILEDLGQRLPFEEPFWSGRHPAVDSGEDPEAYPFPFHPLDLGEAALGALFGYQLEGIFDEALLDPTSIPLIKYKRG